MSIIVSGISLNFQENSQVAIETALKKCGINANTVNAEIYKRSIDARRGKINMVYSVCIDGIENEQPFVEKLQMASVRLKVNSSLDIKQNDKKLTSNPVIVGFGPAGLFCAYILAKYGYNPIVIERGDTIEMRDKKVYDFDNGGTLDENSNIQFGEGGAGTYSDGKLTTRINDPICEQVLQILCENGAPDEIKHQAKPHIGTDILKTVVKKMREYICNNGGAVHFNTTLTGIIEKNGVLQAISTDKGTITCENAVLAIGHSARDTFTALEHTIYMEPKAFSVGARIEHKQSDIDKMLYGKYAGHELLPSAEYTLSHKTLDRACYSFCMCPGGLVVAAQSEHNSITTNGMSYHARNGTNSNSAIVVSVSPKDFGNDSPLAGIEFQRQIEKSAFNISGSYSAPCQLVSDFLENRASTKLKSVKPSYPKGVTIGSINDCLPNFVTNQMQIGLRNFERKMQGFTTKDAILTAPETRTSSPIRIKRNDSLNSVNIQGVIPCGEGAGYAGGIMSAAVDGIKASLQIINGQI